MATAITSVSRLTPGTTVLVVNGTELTGTPSLEYSDTEDFTTGTTLSGTSLLSSSTATQYLISVPEITEEQARKHWQVTINSQTRTIPSPLYKLEWKNDCRTTLVTDWYGEGDSIIVPDDLSAPKGYVFDGWETDVPSTMDDCDLEMVMKCHRFTQADLTEAETQDLFDLEDLAPCYNNI